MRYAVVLANTVVNLVEWDGVTPWTPPANSAAFPAGGLVLDINWQWNNGTPSNPNPPPAAPAPFDVSSFDNLDKVLKAFGLVVRDYANALQAGTYTQKTIAQVKADYQAKYVSLP